MPIGFFQSLWVSVSFMAALVLAFCLSVDGEPVWVGQASVYALVGFFALALVGHFVWLGRRMVFDSCVAGHVGECVPTWLNGNQVYANLEGGVSGFFRPARKLPMLPMYVAYGPEFHGRIEDKKVLSTEKAVADEWTTDPAVLEVYRSGLG